jgi:hypothetical protein
MEVPILLDVLDNLPKKMWDWYGFEVVRHEAMGSTFLCIGKSVRGTVYAVSTSHLQVKFDDNGDVVFEDDKQRVSISRNHYRVEAVANTDS